MNHYTLVGIFAVLAIVLVVLGHRFAAKGYTFEITCYIAAFACTVLSGYGLLIPLVQAAT